MEMRNMDFEETLMIVGFIILATVIIMTLLISMVSDAEKYKNNIQKKDVLPPPPPKPKVCRCEYCKGIISLKKVRCDNCGAYNMQYTGFHDNQIEPNFPKDRTIKG